MKDIQTMNWRTVTDDLNTKGYAVIENILSVAECKHLAGLYDDSYLYRNTINMQRYRFGQGEYKYFNYPLPLPIQSLREIFYTPLATIANEWMQKLETDIQFPSNHSDFVKQCQAKAQTRDRK